LPPGGLRVPGHHFTVGDTRALVRYWRPEDVEWAIRAVRDHELRPAVEIWQPAVEFLHRFGIGVPIHGHERFEELRGQIDLELLSRYITQTRAMHSESFYTDGVTRLRAGRVHDALLMARIAYDTAVDAYLATLGETNPQEKWRHKRVARAAGTGLLRADYERAMLGPGPDATDAGIERYVAMLLLHTGTLNCCVQLGCSYETLTLTDPGPAEGPPVKRALDARLARRYDGDVYAVHTLSGAAVRLNPTAALVFGCAGGRWSAAQLARHVAAFEGRPLPEVTADVDTVLAELGSRGFLRPVTP
ncbi:MAG: PqqD family protein, partial [Nonomuraea sp.]|nr:PqqD family protein [Nonomuraea sp.]